MSATNPPIPPGGPDDILRMDASELAALYTAGALTSAEMVQLEARVRGGDTELRAELDRAKPVLEALLEAESIAPGRHVREGIEAKIAHEAGENEDVGDGSGVMFGSGGEQRRRSRRDIGLQDDRSEGFVIVRQSEGRWLPTGLRGVRFRQLSADRRANRRTIMLRMDPGTELPDHDHAGLEEVLVVSGTLKIGDELLGPGDYFRASEGVVHGTPVSPNGCVCIIVSGYIPFPASNWFGFVWAAIKSLLGRRS